MGIFGRIRERKDPDLLKNLNRYLSFCTRLAEKDATIQFFEGCITRDVYPCHFWKQLRRSHIRPDSVTLKRHARNYVDTLKSESAEFRRILNLQQPIASELPEKDRQDYLKYVEAVTKQRVSKKLMTLERSPK